MTVLDNLQIEIHSSSTNALRGIDALAESLGKLKKNSAFKAVSTNLEKLSGALNGLPNVHQASNSLRTLANSIEKLKGVGTVSGLSNSLAKLPTALKSLGNINLDKVAPQIRGVVDAVAPLSSLKSGGLSTMVNAMTKLGKVTESLDDETIGKFAAKVALLNEKLAPLSAKMSTIKAGFSAINSNARSATTAVKDFGDGVNTSTLNMSSFIDVARTAIDTIRGLVQKFTEFMNEAIEWDGIAARFGRGFGEGAQETYAWIQRLNEEMGINIQQFMKYSSVYATMLTGFGVANEDATKMALGYTELTYDIWAGYNDIYKSFDEASEAVKSAIAGEVEPIRRAGFTIIESTLEQTAANHGLEISLANATEAQKSYLRYLALVDQAHSQNLVGTYAKELNTAEGLMRTFAQQLKSLTQAFGSLFLPILTKVMPYLQAFVELLEDGIRAVAAFFGIEIQDIGDTWGGYNSGVSDAVDNTQNVTGALNDATAAAKELKNATLGIDELNVISPPSASSGSGGGAGSGAGGNGFAGLDVDSLWDESIFDSVQSKVDEIKEKLKDWMPVLAGIATALTGLKLTNLLGDLELAGFKLSNLSKAISVAGISLAVGKLVWDFTGAYLEGGDEADLLKALGTTVLGTALAGWMAGKPGAAFVLLVSGVVTLTKLGVEIGKGTVEWNDTESLVTMLVGGVETAIGAVFTWKFLGPIVKKLWPKVVTAATPALAAAGPYIGIAAAVVGGIVLAFVDYDFTDVGRKIGEKVGGALSTAGKYIWSGIKTAFNWVVDNFDIDDVWDILAILFVPGEWIKRIAPKLEEIFTKIGDWIEDKIENLKGNINEFFGGFFDGLFDGLGWDMSWADDLKIQYTDIVEAVVNPISVPIKLIKEGWKSVKDWIGKILPVSQDVSLKKSGWSTVKKWVGNISTLAQNISLKKSGWSSVKKWVGNLSTLSQNIKLAKSGWSSVSKWIGSMPSLSAKIKLVKNGWSSVKKWLGNLDFKLNFKLPKIGVNWGTKEVMGFKIKYPSSFYTYAQGGFPNEGEFFLAREAGPEMVGKIGNRSAVVNNDQIVEAISEGVYAAVSAAMRGDGGSGGAQEFHLYIDGREITSTVERRQRERGASLFGKEVYSY